MSFAKDKNYWEYRLKTINRAIKGNKDSLKDLEKEGSNVRGIAAHKQYIKELNKVKKNIKANLKEV